LFHGIALLLPDRANHQIYLIYKRHFPNGTLLVIVVKYQREFLYGFLPFRHHECAAKHESASGIYQ